MLFVYIQWLENEFLGYLKEWEKSVEQRNGFTAAQKRMMILSNETIEGLKITGSCIYVYIRTHIYIYIYIYIYI